MCVVVMLRVVRVVCAASLLFALAAGANGGEGGTRVSNCSS